MLNLIGTSILKDLTIDWVIELIERENSGNIQKPLSGGFCKKVVLKKETLVQVFPWEFCKILSITFLTEHLRWLLLNIVTKKKRKWWLFLHNYFSHSYNIHSIFMYLIGGVVVLLSFAFLCFHLVCVLIM